jgi:hypothetical protein
LYRFTVEKRLPEPGARKTRALLRALTVGLHRELKLMAHPT